MKLLQGDCLELMKDIPNNSVDLVLTDPPYGTTACKWDSVINFDSMWAELQRITKDSAVICLFGSEPFSSRLRCSNLKLYKYDWIWNKKLAGNAINAKRHPLKIHELISVFYKKPRYFPQMVVGKHRKKMGFKHQPDHIGKVSKSKDTENNLYYPTSIYTSSAAGMRGKRLHPTQKPVALLEYLIKTYTLENETVLDFTMGSGSTGVAAKNLNRNFIGIEKDPLYYQISCARIEGNEELARELAKARKK